MKVNRYQQQNLASSLVGTPGVDRSGEILAGAQAAVQGQRAQVANAINANANQQQQQIIDFAANNFAHEVRQAKYVQRQAKEAQDKMNADVAIANKGTALALEFDNLFTSVKKANMDTPGNSMGAFTQQALDMRDRITSSASSEYEKLALLKDYGTKYDTYVKGMNSWVTERSTEVGGVALDRNAKALPQMLLSVDPNAEGGIKQYKAKLDEWQKKNQPAIDLYKGKDADKWITQQRHNAVDQLLHNMSYTNPGAVTEAAMRGDINEMYDNVPDKVIEAVNFDHAQIIAKKARDQLFYDKRDYEKMDKTIQYETDIPVIAQTDPSKASDMIVELYDGLRASQQQPQHLRNKEFEKYTGSVIRSALRNNITLENMTVARMGNSANFKRLAFQDQQIADVKAKQDSEEQMKESYRLGENFRNKTDTEINTMMDNLNNARKNDKLSSGINGTVLKNKMAELVKARNENKINENDLQRYKNVINQMSETVYNEKKDDTLFSMFIDHRVAGPSDPFLAALGISKYQADGKTFTSDYVDIKNRVEAELDAAMKAQNTPMGAQMSPQQKVSIWVQAQNSVMHKWIGDAATKIDLTKPAPNTQPKPPAFDSETERLKVHAQFAVKAPERKPSPSPAPKAAAKKATPAPRTMVPPPPPGAANMGAYAGMSKADRKRYADGLRAQADEMEALD